MIVALEAFSSYWLPLSESLIDCSDDSEVLEWAPQE